MKSVDRYCFEDWGVFGEYVSAENFDRITTDLEQRCRAAERRVEKMEELLHQASMLILDAELLRAIESTLNPTAEAEPQCLLCLDKKTVPGNIPGGFVKDCPDCCGEEG